MKSENTPAAPTVARMPTRAARAFRDSCHDEARRIVRTAFTEVRLFTPDEDRKHKTLMAFADLMVGDANQLEVHHG